MVGEQQQTVNQQRHGSAASSGAESHKSEDTVTDYFAASPVGQGRRSFGETDQHNREDSISPGSVHGLSIPSSYKTALNDRKLPGVFGNHRRDLAVLQTSEGERPSKSRQPPTTLLPGAKDRMWGSNGSARNMPSSVFPSDFLDDPSDTFAFGPPRAGRQGSNAEVCDAGQYQDDRRPSAASINTASSSGSKSSIGNFHKKLTSFFGEDLKSGTSPHGSEASLQLQDKGSKDQQAHAHRDRNNSLRRENSTDDRVPSPTSTRPHTPLPSSEVTPWVFQDPEDIPKYGEAPVNGDLSGPDRQRFVREKEASSQRGTAPVSSHRSHRLHFPGHRHNKSNEDSAKASQKEPVVDTRRPKTSREHSASNLRHLKEVVPSAMTSRTSLAPRSGSPTPSVSSGLGKDNYDGTKSAQSSAKRSIFEKLKRKPKDERDMYSLSSQPGSTQAFHDPFAKTARQSERRRTNTSSGAESPLTVSTSDRVKTDSQSKKEGVRPHLTTRLTRAPKRGQSVDPSMSVDSDAKGATGASNLFLDLDLSHMEGIISQPPAQTPPDGGIFLGGPPGAEPTKPDDLGDNAAWDAPDSWAVKKVGDEALQRLRELDDSGLPGIDEGVPYCIRIFRIDSTFATLSAQLNSTVAEILHQLGKKSFLQDDLGNYQIIMRKQDLQRPLEQSERPIFIQKRLLEQAGYQEKDHIEEVGREDNSYLVRFTFVPTKLSGYYSLDKDPGFSKTQKFSHVDLSGRNLITIPIALYQRATEIITLNLSRNLALDIPKDFIQGCTNLREIRFTSNEAWQLPKSLSLASRLTVLDISNNKLEQLEHAELDRLHGLVSIKAANNKLTSLPASFGQFMSLRSLTVSSNYLETVPACICNLKSLVDLDLSFNQISELPSAFGELTTLERFWATNNRLSGGFPESFGQLSNLKEIDVRFNEIADIGVISTLPRLEQLMAGHNAISVFEGTFPRLRTLHLSHNPITSFNLLAPVPSLTTLNLASAKLNQLDDGLFDKMPNMDKLILDKNHFVTLSGNIGMLRKLQWLSIARNSLNTLPPEIGYLTELRILDVRENNLKKLPSEIWCASKLETFNASANLLESFPKPGPSGSMSSDATTLINTQPDGSLPSSPSFEELGKLEDFHLRRPSQVSSGYLSVNSSPGGPGRKNSVASLHMSRRNTLFSRSPSDTAISTAGNRKDSAFSQRLSTTIAGSLRNLYLADNRLNDDVFDELILLSELRILNLSYNELFDIPPRSLRRWQNLSELYLSGNQLTSLPSDDLEEISSLKVLHINGNRFQTLPAELGKVSKLSVLDVGNNALKYNVSNWPYDWNWNWNRALKYLNLSGNKRLEIKPNLSYGANANREGKDLTDFGSLTNLRVLGLMDVTLTIPSVPDQTEDRRVRTSASAAGPMAYGMADTIGRHEHLSTVDLVVPRLRAEQENEVLLGMFDGQVMSTGGSKVAKFLHENFQYYLAEELKRLQQPDETPVDALRRTYLTLNKELGTVASQALDGNQKPGTHSLSHRGSNASQVLSAEDVMSGSVATTILFQGAELYCANVGDAEAMIIHSAGKYTKLTRKHDPAEATERQRIRDAGGYVSRQGRLNDQLEVSRAFGYIQLMPAVIAAPAIAHVTIKEQDEMILIASKELWDYLTPDFIVDVARSERGDLMIAAQKLRDLAISFGATGKIMVMMIGVSDLKKSRPRYRGASISMGPTGSVDEGFLPMKRGKRPRDAPDDSTLARLDQEVEAPTGYISMAFTDIKNSTLLWETSPAAMRSAIKLHNSIMRRQLRIIGGYEVKTEGDAFMVSFPTATSALLWCFAVQNELLDAQWPSEILNSIHGQEKFDSDGNRIFRGLSVRMGIHWGNPVCEPDPVTRRMDYFGPMVNRASRISSVADGGQITVSADFIAEIQRTLNAYAETERTGSTGSEDTLSDDYMGQAIRRELRTLTAQGFEVKEIGERKLKGLENPEQLFLVYPHSLAGRLDVQQSIPPPPSEAKDPATKSKDSELGLDTDEIWGLWHVSLRLEMLCSSLNSRDGPGLKAPEVGLLDHIKSAGGEVTDQFIVGLIEHHVTRIEACISELSVRHMVHPFQPGVSLKEHAGPISDILDELQQKLALLQQYQSLNQN